MGVFVYNRIKNLIEETNDAFASCRGSVNSDYAEFATMSLADFKNALQDPRLTRDDLMKILRTGTTEHKSADPESCWATFMAHYIARGANKNTSKVDEYSANRVWNKMIDQALSKEKS